MNGDASSSIFISHSCKDREGPPVGDGAAELQRWERLLRAREVRDAIQTALEDRGYAVRLDVEDLRAGDVWRAELHAWLGTCNGAVVLLDEDSARSPWVRKEATILSWRAELGKAAESSRGLKLIPVFLDGFQTRTLNDAGLGALDLSAHQAVRCEADERPATVAEKVAQEFGQLPADVGSDSMQSWILEVNHLLGLVDDLFLRRAAGKLAVSEEEYSQFTTRTLFLAHHLLHIDPRRALDALEQLQKDLTGEKFVRLVGLVSPGWVSEESAQVLHRVLAGRVGAGESVPTPATGLNIDQSPVLPLDAFELGRDYVQRAYCCQLPPHRLVSFPEKLGERPEHAVLAVEQALAEKMCLDAPAEIDEYLRVFSEPYFVLVGRGAMREEILRALTARFGTAVRFVVLAGDLASDAAREWATLVPPKLSAEQARDACFAQSRAKELVRG